MGVYIITKKEKTLKKIFPRNTIFLPEVSGLSKQPKDEDADCTLFFDVSCVTEDDVQKGLTILKRINKNASWAKFDHKGSINESAKKGEGTGPFDTGIKLPSESAFPGWKKMTAGKTMPFYLLYCSLQGKTALDSRLEEKVIVQIRKRFLAVINNYFQEGDGLFWMDTGKDCLFLFPPRAACAEAAVKACMDLIVAAPQFVLETFGLQIPSNFIFALHYGSISYKPPGKTGTIVSDAINYVFHLGSKKAEPGRLTISGELPEKSIPKSLQDCFVSAGKFSDREVWHTKKFEYAKPWV